MQLYTTLILLGCFTYAIARYVLFGPVDPVHIPVYILNKAVAMSAAVFLFLTALNDVQKKYDHVRNWGRASLHAVLLHIVLSLTILSSAYYGKFYAHGKMNLLGELTMLFGVVAAYFYWRIDRLKERIVSSYWLLPASALFLSGHLVAMGVKGWLSPAKWYGSLPPISLLSFLFSASAALLFIRLLLRRKPVADSAAR